MQVPCQCRKIGAASPTAGVAAPRRNAARIARDASGGAMHERRQHWDQPIVGRGARAAAVVPQPQARCQLIAN